MCVWNIFLHVLTLVRTQTWSRSTVSSHPSTPPRWRSCDTSWITDASWEAESRSSCCHWEWVRDVITMMWKLVSSLKMRLCSEWCKKDCLRSGLTAVCGVCFLQKSQIYTWDGKMPLRWRKLESFKLELPRDTLLSVEVVQELKGEVGGQRSGQRNLERRNLTPVVLSARQCFILSVLAAVIKEVFAKWIETVCCLDKY